MQDPPAREPSTDTAPLIPIVGIGASAGGLAALRELFKHMPSDSGVAFVVVMHLSPSRESHLKEALALGVEMPVKQVAGTTRLERDTIYVIPPNKNISAIDTHLHLSELETKVSERAPIDHFFQTLAASHDGSAVGIVLSGTGSDGALGLRSIRERGGLTIVQLPSEAGYDEMPRSALQASRVDAVLPLAEIPGEVLSFLHAAAQLSATLDEAAADASTERFLREVFAVLLSRTGRDFTDYKRSTILRRISRRMQYNELADPEQYLDFMREKAEEAETLSDDLLINVTSFFRDVRVFDVLAKHVMPKLFEGKGRADSVRVWSAGCATGEEAYSLAMLLTEEAERHEAPPHIQIFASDLHPKSLEAAREGVFRADIEASVDSERLARFFVKNDDGYRLRRDVRELVTFASHNLLADPPFSRLDMVSCRNVLIYLHRDLHPQVAELFHYALRGEGFLLLGAAEGIDHADLFRLEDKQACLYRRRNVPGPEPRLPVFPIAQGRRMGRGGALEGVVRDTVGFGTLHQFMVEQYGPPSVLVSPENNVVHFSEHAGRYLVHPGGSPTASVFKLIREELRVELRSAISTARSQRCRVRTRSTTFRCEGRWVGISLDLRPALEPEQDGFVLLIFDEGDAAPEQATDAGEGDVPGDYRSARLREAEAERQLAEKRLERLFEEHEVRQQELRASNEELQSANEELRSTMEELETTKEELQSMNEGLRVVNQQNQDRVGHLDQLSSDLQNLLFATDIATLFLDRECRILRFTPRIEKLFNIKPADRGRALSDFTTRLGDARLAEDARTVVETLVPTERRIRDEGGTWYLTRVLPYRDSEERIAGVVVTFVDVTSLHLAEEAAVQARETSEHILECLPSPLLVLTPDLNVRSANLAFYRHFAVDPEDTLGRKVYNLGNRQWNIPSLQELLENVLPRDQVFRDYEVDHYFEGLGRRVMLLDGRRLDSVDLILLGIRDITERDDSARALRESERRLRALVAASSEAMFCASPGWEEVRLLDGRTPVAETGSTQEAWLEESVFCDDRPRVRSAIASAIRDQSPLQVEHRIERSDGNVSWVASHAVPVLDDDGRIVEWFGASSNVTQCGDPEGEPT